MVSATDHFFLSQSEPDRSCLLYLRGFILSYSVHFTEHWKYGMPFYYYKMKPCCYLWRHKTFKVPYLSFVDGDRLQHPGLRSEKRARMKIFLVEPGKDIPIKELESLLKQALAITELKIKS